MLNYELRVTNIRGLIGINQNDAVLSIRQSPANMQIDIEPGRVDTKIELPQVIIDQSQCFSEMGLKDIMELSAGFAAKGRQGWLSGIARTVAEGNRMADIQHSKNAIAEIARSKVLRPPGQSNIALMPKSRPEIDFAGELSFDVKPAKVRIEPGINSAEISATRHSVSYYWKRPPFFNMEFVGKNLDINT